MVIPMVFKNAITIRSAKDVRPTDVGVVVEPADLFMDVLLPFQKNSVLPLHRWSRSKNLFKQVFRVMIRCTSFTSAIHGEEEEGAPKRRGQWQRLSLFFFFVVRRVRRDHTRTLSKNADDRCPLEGVSTFHPCFRPSLCCALFEKTG